MKTRIISSICALLLFIPYVLLAEGTEGFSVVAMCQLIGVTAALEILKMTGFFKSFYVSVPAVGIAYAIPLAARLYGDEFFAGCGITFFLFSLYLLSFAVFKGNHSIQDYATMFMMLFYVVISVSCIVMLYQQNYGQYIYLLCFLSAWVTDTFAYFTGRAFGRHKLCPKISPKKTVEGAIGGLVFCVLFVLGYALVISKLLDVKVQVISVLVGAAFMSVVSMLGDLIASLGKRHYNIKDYGNVLPGHGGAMDRFDSVFATAPILFILYIAFDGFAFFT